MSKNIIQISGKDFITFEGLLELFHANKGKSIHTVILNMNPFIVQATVEGEKGKYQGIGDADQSNTNSMIYPHRIRMAETRAIARALRLYNNIGICSVEELGEGTKQPTQTQVPIQQTSLGNCPNCNAPMKMSKNNKPYCSKKCWL